MLLLSVAILIAHWSRGCALTYLGAMAVLGAAIALTGFGCVASYPEDEDPIGLIGCYAFVGVGLLLLLPALLALVVVGGVEWWGRGARAISAWVGGTRNSIIAFLGVVAVVAAALLLVRGGGGGEDAPSAVALPGTAVATVENPPDFGEAYGCVPVLDEAGNLVTTGYLSAPPLVIMAEDGTVTWDAERAAITFFRCGAANQPNWGKIPDGSYQVRMAGTDDAVRLNDAPGHPWMEVTFLEGLPAR
ncbi:MAG: hypothetical protein R3C39_13720 [Dehalococcoidia bacterium]